MELRGAYLDALIETGQQLLSAYQTGVQEDVLNEWRNDPDFVRDEENAIELHRQDFITKVMQRARDGFDEHVTHGGQYCFTDEGKPVIRKRFSDPAAVRLLNEYLGGTGETDGVKPTQMEIVLVGGGMNVQSQT